MYGPGSPSIQNVIPGDVLGTTPTAALVPSLIATVASFVMIFLWLEYRARSFTKRGYLFFDERLKTQLSAEELLEDNTEEKLPNPYMALIPIALILVMYNAPLLVKEDGSRGGFPVETAVIAGVIWRAFSSSPALKTASPAGSRFLTRVRLIPACLS